MSNPFDDEELLEPSAEELEEAATLARALDGRGADAQGAGAAFETAALLRAGVQPQLSDEAKARVALELQVQAEGQSVREVEVGAGLFEWRRWSLILAPLAAGAAGLWLVVAGPSPGAKLSQVSEGVRLRAPAPAPSRLALWRKGRGRSDGEGSLPAPHAALLRAQMTVLTEPARDRGQFETEMQRHRSEVLALLEVD